MNYLANSSIALFLCAFLSGCELLCQAGTMGCGMTNEQIERLLNPKAYGEYWTKPGASIEQRRQDSWSCGAAPTIHAADHVVFTDEQKLAEKRPEEKDEFKARERLTIAWVKCMQAKGYEYQDTQP